MENKFCPSCFQAHEEAVCPHCNGAQNKDHQLPVGTLLHGRYQIGKVLGQGGFGITYLGRDSLLGTIVAIKEFYPSGIVFRQSNDSLSVECLNQTIVPHFNYSKERFLREASALVKFRDLPEVVDILDFSEENNTAYIVMEFVKGMNLAAYVHNRGGRLSVEETFRILRPVMEALAKVHKGGIVHRDISPDNIILDPMGGAKLLDFGAVRAVEDPDVEKELNKSTEAIIKQGFAPIEQYNTRGSLGPWTDEYAMCATVWYCLTGKVPEEASIRMSEGIDPDWSSIDGLPQHQQKALTKGFSCRAKDRYKDLDGLLDALFSEAPEEKDAPAKGSPIPQLSAIATTRKTASLKATEKKTALGKIQLWVAITSAILIIFLVAALFMSRAPETSYEGPLPQVETPTEQTGPTAEPISEEERLYLLAEQLLAVGGYQEAIDIYTSLGDYKDSPAKITECHYQWAESFLKEGSFWEAIDKFTQLGEYKDSPLRRAYAEAEILLADSKLGEAAIAFGKLGDHSDARARSFAVWDMLDRNTICASGAQTVGLKNNGTVVAIGLNDEGQCDVSGWTDIVSVCVGMDHTVGLKSDGTVVAVGQKTEGQCNVSSWTDIVAISAGDCHTVGLRSDGTVVAVGLNAAFQCNVSSWTDIIAISAGESYTVGLRSDGTVVAAGFYSSNISGWTDIIAISAGEHHTIGLKADGTVVCAGANYFGECNISDWTDIIAISAGETHTVGLKDDGTVVAVGENASERCNVSGWTDIVAISTYRYHTVGLRSDGTVVSTNGMSKNVNYGQAKVGSWTDIWVPKCVALSGK